MRRLALLGDACGELKVLGDRLAALLPPLETVVVCRREALECLLAGRAPDVVAASVPLAWGDRERLFGELEARFPDVPRLRFSLGSGEVVAFAETLSVALELAGERRARREAELGYRGLFERVPVGLFRSTPQGALLEANPALVAMLGYPDEEALRGVPATRLYRDPSVRRQWIEALGPAGIVRDFEVELLRADGEPLPVLATARVVRDPEGAVVAFEGIVRDVSGRRRTERRIRALNRELERSNRELQTAYEATIEGWSRALEIRDRETRGHTLRVTSLTVELARRMGMGEEDLVQVRRGALLHDIGKLGVPDRILKKPAPLTEEEWEVMRLHPVYAHQWLEPIEYLHRAMEIPWCHHERWDGTGYPRGLAGERIPLAARIFAVVDVWDALTHDRPYRAAWPEKEALARLERDEGRHFDPRIVAEFVRMMRERRGGA